MYLFCHCIIGGIKPSSSDIKGKEKKVHKFASMYLTVTNVEKIHKLLRQEKGAHRSLLCYCPSSGPFLGLHRFN
uniref:Uncharacterized protein n=1 Tax=Arundo donax TaxID=35708 RepID=A0A0A9C907_ARUDO